MSDNENEIFEVTDAPVEEEVKQSEETDVEKASAEEAVSAENEVSESKPASHKRRLDLCAEDLNLFPFIQEG